MKVLMAFIVVACLLMLTVPRSAYANASPGKTQLGLRITDSSKSQGSAEDGQPGSTLLGIRVTTSYVSVCVQFASNGGSEVESQTIRKGDQAVEPAIPQRDGYTFSGWFSDALLTERYDFGSAVAGDMVLYAKWDAVISCKVPAAAEILIDATGRISSESMSFTSSSVVPLEISGAVSSVRSGASLLIPHDTDRAAVQIVLTPDKEGTNEVMVPLDTAGKVVALGFVIPERQGDQLGALSVSFGLSLPQSASISYVVNPLEISAVEYVVKILE